MFCLSECCERLQKTIIISIIYYDEPDERHLEIGDTTRELMVLAVELDIPIILLS